MTHSSKNRLALREFHENRPAFYVVQFIELPFDGIDDYVCVPYTWLIVRRGQRAFVAYPKDEDPCDTRDRVKRKERYSDKWNFYVTVVKYQSDNYRDAECWTATGNGYGHLVEEESKITDTQPMSTLNKKLHSANQSDSSKLNDNFRKPKPRKSIKRSALSKPKKQLDGKRLKQGEAAQSSSAVVNDANKQHREQSINIQDNQSMECAQTEEIAAVSNGENSIMQEQLPSDPVLSQFAVQLEPVQEPQMSVALSVETTSNDQELCTDDVLNNEPNSHHLVNSLKMSADLYSHMSGARSRRSAPIQKTVEKRKLLMNIARSLDNALQNPSKLNQTGSLSISVKKQSPVVTQNQSDHGSQVREMHIGNNTDRTAPLRSIAISSQEFQHVPKNNVERTQDVTTVDPKNVFQNVTNVASFSQNLPSSSHKLPSFIRRLDGHQSSLAQEQHLAQTHRYQHQSTNQDNFQQELLRGSRESNNYDHRPNSRNIRNKIPSMRQNSTHPSNSSQLNQQDSQRQLQRLEIRNGIPITPKNHRQMPTLEGVTKKTPPAIVTKGLNSIQALSTPHKNNLLNELQIKASRSESLHVIESPLHAMDNACQTDKCMVEVPLSQDCTVTSDSNAVTDHKVISVHEMSPDEAPVETTNNVYCTGIATGSRTANRSTAPENSTSTNHQKHPRIVLEQQMLDNFATLFTQMGSTLRYTCDMYHNLRSSVLETAKSYRSLLDNVERFNTVGNSASNASPLRTFVTPEVPQATEERHAEVTARASNENQHSHNVGNKAPNKENNKLWRFVLPLEYEPHDTRWTLKYQTKMPGLVELMPQSDIYVNYGELKYYQHVSEDCKSLARRLLLEVFNRRALSVCLSMSEKAQASNSVGSNVRPGLDEHASKVLLSTVLEYGLKRGWNTDLQPILSTLHSKIEEIRFKFGLMVEC